MKKNTKKKNTKKKKMDVMTKLFIGLAILCTMLVIANFVAPIYGHIEAEKTVGFYGVFGFITFVIIIVAARTLQRTNSRKENYYKQFSVDAETYQPPWQEEDKE